MSSNSTIMAESPAMKPGFFLFSFSLSFSPSFMRWRGGVKSAMSKKSATIKEIVVNLIPDQERFEKAVQLYVEFIFKSKQNNPKTSDELSEII